MIDFIQETGAVTRSWLLQGISETKDVDDSWGCGSLQEVQVTDGEEMV